MRINIKKIEIWQVFIVFIVIGTLLLLVAFEHLLPSFPDMFLGQLVLTRESSSLSPRAYQSAEFILDQIDLSRIDRAEYIKIQEDVLFWEPHYVGYPRTELSRAEITQLQQILSNGHLFEQDADGNGFQCVTGLAAQQPELTPCTDGNVYQEQYLNYQFDAVRSREVGVLQLYLSGGQLVEIRVYPTKRGFAFEPYEKAGEWWFRGVSSSPSFLDEISARVLPQPIKVLWPKRNSEQANRRGYRVIGDQYNLALETVLKAEDVQRLFGAIQEIRPAVGINHYSSWMDSTSVQLTFRVIGANGKGAVLVRGLDCFDVQMVFEGEPIKSSMDFLCP